MKRMKKGFVVAGIVVSVFSLSSQAQATLLGSINDDYVGSDDHGWNDVIGNGGTFNIASLNAYQSGTQLTIDVLTDFAGRGDDKLFSSYSYGKGIGYGDLFLSSAWTPYGNAPYKSDDASNGTTWQYVFALDNRWSANGGSGTLYQLNGTDNSQILLSDDFLSGAIYRNGQAVAVDTGLMADSDIVSTGSWSINSTGKVLSFTFDIAGTSLWSGPELALHYAHTCGNDVIEGAVSAPVPEPATMFLMGTGLAGLASFRRRKFSRE